MSEEAKNNVVSFTPSPEALAARLNEYLKPLQREGEWEHLQCYAVYAHSKNVALLSVLYGPGFQVASELRKRVQNHEAHPLVTRPKSLGTFGHLDLLNLSQEVLETRIRAFLKLHGFFELASIDFASNSN